MQTATRTKNTVAECARALLERIDNMTSDQFHYGGERAEREALRRALAEQDAAAAEIADERQDQARMAALWQQIAA